MTPQHTMLRATSARRGSKLYSVDLKALILAGVIVVFAVVPSRVSSQTIGPSPPTITATINVAGGTTTVVGSTAVSVTGATNASNVTGGTLVWDAAAGLRPGLITVQSQNGNALQAAGGTILVPNDNLAITTGGGHAVLANGTASTVTFSNGASITLTGVGAGLAAIGGTISATGVVISGTAASRGHGAVAESGGTVNLHAGTSISTGGGFNAVALGSSGLGSRVNADVLIPVTTTGQGAMGIYLHDGGQVSLLPGSTLNINGTSSVGVAADNTTVALGTIGSSLTINLNGVGVPAQAGSTGVVALNGGNISLQNLTVTGSNGAAGVWAAPNSTVTLTGTNTININSAQNPTFYTLQTATLVTPNGPVGSIFGVTGGTPISGLFSTGGTINSTGTTINVATGNGAAGADIQANGLININANTITTTGTNSFGVRVDNGTLIGTNSSVTTSGGGAALFFNAGPGLINLTNSTVLATGANTSGLTSLNLTANGLNTVNLTGGSLISNLSTAVEAQGPLNVTTSGTVVTGGGGTLLQTFTNGALQPTVVNFTAAQGSELTGDALIAANTVANISLLTASHWTGAAFNATNVSVDPTSVWTVTASSTVSQTVTNAGLIQFTPPTGDPTQLASFKTLTTANYVGIGGTLGLNTFLGTDGSPSDRLVINGGTASGNSLLRITNAGGPGALTTGNGILVVDTINGGTTVPGTFALARPVAAGPFDYTLFRSSVDASNDQAWFLRSTIECALAPNDPICAGPNPNPTPPDFRPETSLYAAIPSMALLYGRTLLDTLHERVGDEEADLRGRPRQDGVAAGAWARVIGQHGNNEGDPLGIFGSGPKFDYNIGAFQGGQDLLRLDGADGSRDHAGFYAAIGLLTGGVTHFDRTFAGNDNLTAYSFGGYWTHFGAPGWYLDAILQGTLYNVKGSSLSLPVLETNGWGFASSLEAGYPIKLGGGFVIEPQAQIVYQNVSISDTSDTAATVQFRNADSLAARIGARLARTWWLDDNVQRAITAWIRPSLWNEFRGDPQTLFSSAAGPVPFQSNIGGTWVEVNAGLDAQITKATSLFASVGYQVNTNGNMTAYNGKGGLRVAW